MISFEFLSTITGGKILCQFKNLPVRFLVTDSRKAFFSDSSVFFALKGTLYNGHDFIDELYNKGIRQFVIEKENFPVENYPQSNFILVNNGIRALQLISAAHRRLFNLKVVGITGSNGKTIVKEWLSQILSWRYNVVKSPKSFNSQIGVPLSVWQINENHEFGVFEAGISGKGEMEKLQEMIRPEIGIFTNIGPAHDEGFQSREEKISEKLKLFNDTSILVFCADHPDIEKLARLHLKSTDLVSWGTTKDHDYQIQIRKEALMPIQIFCNRENRRINFRFHFTDSASIENILHCIVLLLHLGWDENIIQEALSSLSKVSMRLELKKGINNCYIIDDTYNNDLISLEIGLNFLSNQVNKDRKTLILSDILQTGLPDDVLYRNTSDLLRQYHIQKVIGIGTSVLTLKKFFDGQFIGYPDVNAFTREQDLDDFKDEAILIKGARVFSLEKITALFQEKIHGTVLEIDLDSITHNFNFYRSLLKPDTKMMVMVKALAYGSGSLEIANRVQYLRADYLGVAFPDEGVFLRKNGISMPVMIMNASNESFQNLLDFRLEPEIYSVSMLDELNRFIQVKKLPVNIHLKLDTGMHRLGLDSSDLPVSVGILKSNPLIRVKSIFSHLSAADDPQFDEFTRKQLTKFSEMTEYFSKYITYPFIRHICNSAAIPRFPEYHFDMVRLGIGLYGMEVGSIESGNLRPVSILKTIISQIKEIEPGESVGYGRKGMVKRKSKIATLAIGYADGFSRAFSNGVGKVWVNGSLAPVIGNVCMDMTMIDITGIEAVEGEEVIIFGKEYPIGKMAATINTIPYEILTSVSERVKRIYLKD